MDEEFKILILQWCKVFDEFIYHGVYLLSDNERKALREESNLLIDYLKKED